MQSTHFTYFKYGLSILFLIVILLTYQFQFNTEEIKSPSPKKTSADFFIDDQQQHFQSANSSSVLLNGTMASNETLPSCDCPSSLYSTNNITLVPFGENTPLVVPEFLSPIQPDILEKMMVNSKDQGLIVTVAGYAMRVELYNWIDLLKAADEESFLVFCTDTKLYMHLVVTGYEDQAVLIPDDWFLDNLELFRNTENNMLDNEIARLTHVKTWVLQRLAYVTDIQNVLMLDVNQIMLHARTMEYMQTLLHIRHDTQLITTQDSSDQHVMNSGLVMMRTNANLAKRVLASTVRIQEQNYNQTQQQAFNSALSQLELHVKTGMTVLLDIIHFPNGINYFDNDLSGSRGIEPYIIHANHKFGEERISLLQERGFWVVNSDYIASVSNQVEDIFKKREENNPLEERDLSDETPISL
ncbi:uncharacterized protein EV154DRAFT_491111 [Mucor mucedo]|uniref:uncharacterized protein n=1 Tax=Mucor mucedo TaxID=29922 RepID=UPI00221EF28B|nr:uncharacterized protein EV154DRAFT_491111 [Mucor mucedo]KAI7896879.1 hypothetical protein EV154DRAFT_491111 [Mucor mucedo]